MEHQTDSPVDPLDWAIENLRHPVPNQAEIDRESAETLRMELHECPECNRKFLSTSTRCPWCNKEE